MEEIKKEYTYELLNATTGEVVLANPTEFGGQGEDGTPTNDFFELINLKADGE